MEEEQLKYDFSSIESKWQQRWDDQHTLLPHDYTKPKYYALVEFPYPSGQGLHVGHPRSYTALDIVARKRRLQGYNVLYPMGWDAFGLPTENFAIKNHIHPEIVTKNNVARFKQQLQVAWASPLTGTAKSTPPIRLLQMDPVDFLAAVQKGTGIQKGDVGQLVYLL